MAITIETKRYTYQDYRNLDVDDNFLYELIDEELVQKNAPSPQHQRISRKLLILLNTFIDTKQLGEIFYAPIDVFLDEYNAPQPDLVFVSNAQKSIITQDGIMGAPDLVVEIISSSSLRQDRGKKMKLYKNYQIPEYWLIDLISQAVEVYFYENNEYELVSSAVEKGLIQSKVLTDFQFDVAGLFS
ncbi:MAG: Uma2 family endonuclease [Microscillaceae bacterium]|jgi:Uma2 family endonuclease|nr:Uma2 family endonuclease [Microscillaceae bacterium]